MANTKELAEEFSKFTRWNNRRSREQVMIYVQALVTVLLEHGDLKVQGLGRFEVSTARPTNLRPHPRKTIRFSPSPKLLANLNGDDDGQRSEDA
jgi:nucleoid DNA-binding protein